MKLKGNSGFHLRKLAFLDNSRLSFNIVFSFRVYNKNFRLRARQLQSLKITAEELGRRPEKTY
jgi:hypothetical protein